MNITPEPIHFCTYFDSRYFHRGLALYRSLERQAGRRFTLWTLCLDDTTFEALQRLGLPGIVPIRLADLEAGEPRLLDAKKNRSTVEYYWTLTPCLPLHVFRGHPEVKVLSYVDADIGFFAPPDAIAGELGDGSVLIVPHDLSDEYKSEERSGKYNVGILAFRLDDNGLGCLSWWRDRCLEWCHERHEDGKFGDQGYLNDWPERFQGVVVSENVGLRMAPWNVGKYPISTNGGGQVFVDGVPLVCYHYHALHFCTGRIVFLAAWPVKMAREWRSLVYLPYVRDLMTVERDLIDAGYELRLAKRGIPWRYVLGRIVKGQPIRHFMRVHPQ